MIGRAMKMKPKTAFLVGCSTMVGIGLWLTLFFAARLATLYSIGRLTNLFNQNPLLSSAVTVDAGLCLLSMTVGFVLIVKALQQARKYLGPTGKRAN
jgi:hypothetical protein